MRLDLTTRWTMLGLALSLYGCTLAIDTELQQCTEDSDCAALSGGNATQRCVKNFCEHVECETTTDCRDQATSDKDPFAHAHCSAGLCEPAQCSATGGCEGNTVCEVELGVCVAEDDASCDPNSANQGDDDCKRFAGFDDRICLEGTCQKAQCTTDKQCQVSSDTMTDECDKGRCADLTWGCIGNNVERDVPMSGTATLEMRVISLINGDAVKDLSVKVCSVQLDPNCLTPVAGADWSYDEESSLLTVTGLKQKSLVRLLLTAPNMADAEWYSQRAVIGVNREAGPTILVPPNAGELLGGSFMPPIPVDMETKATLLARIYNCKGEAAVGVSLDVPKVAETQIFYTDEFNQILVDRLETVSTGTAGAVNLSAQATRVKVFRDEQLVTEFDLTALRPKVITYLQLYPYIF